MSVITIPKVLRDKLGDDGTDALVKVLNESDSVSGKDYATKADIADVKGEIKAVRLEMKLYFIILLFVIILSNPKALELIGKLIGIIK
jgi:hypothetical protein